ncbi:hypothetical protein OOT46_23615 [Aquabacterium sp. A7-Y]|uniref:hypothetical protein n=1 Tax=Aquabacterium sp. A7-Y TaxID=1349605 RepID=UPI00223E338B|nr:hypothetical protein [Aquabacterium sp. A7-Y]MCW7540812.1 hypothetical protein [Aquabacterium sp. A7-Y]
MKIGPLSFRTPASTAERSRTEPTAEPGQNAVGRASTRAGEVLDDLQRRGPTKLRIAPGLPFHSRASIGPTAPDVRGPAPPEPAPTAPSGRRLPASRLAGLQHKLEGATAALTGPQHPQAGAWRQPESADAMRSPAACREAMRRMLGPGSESLADRLLQPHIASAAGGPLAFEAPLLLASALHAVCHQDHRLAGAVLGRLDGSDIGAASAAETVAMNRLQRTLAATPAGMDLLCRLERRPADPVRNEAYQAALQISHALLAQGRHPGGTASLEDFRRVAAADPESARRIGERDDAPHRLASKALLYALAIDSGDMHGIDRTHRAAYVAWRNGFTESGPGTDFNKATLRLSRFSKYAERGEHGVASRSPARVLQGVGRALAKPFGKQLSPMQHMREGAHGATLGELKAEKAGFETGLRDAISRVRVPLHREARALLAQAARSPAEEARLTRLVTRIATLDQWSEAGRKGIKPDAADVQRRAAELFPQHALDAQALKRELKSSPKLQLQTLQDWGSEVLDEVGRTAFTQQVQQLREAAGGSRARSKVFTVDDMRTLALQLVRGNDIARFSDGGTSGISIAPAFQLATAAAPTVGLGPDLKAEKGRHATVQFGVSSVGGEVFVGMEKRRAAHAGVNATLGLALGENAGAGFSAGVKHGIETVAAEGVAIRTRKGSDAAWKDKTAEVVNFLFDQVRPPEGQARPADPAELWQRFADRFHADRDISLNWVTQDAKTHKTSASVGAGVRGGLGSWRIGPAVSAGVEHSRMSAVRDDASGQWTTAVSSQGSRTQLALNASLVGTGPPVHRFSDSTAQPAGGGLFAGQVAVQSASLPGATLLGVGVDINFGGENGAVRLTQEQGRIQPALSFRQREFVSAGDFAAYLETRRPEWQGVLGERDDTGVLTGGQAAFDAFLRELRALPAPGNKSFIERRSLEPEVAARVDAYNARAATLRGAGDLIRSRAPLDEGTRSELQALENEVHRLLADDASWRPARLYASESNSTLKESGIDFVLKLNGRGEASASRDLLSLQARHEPSTPTIAATPAAPAALPSAPAEGSDDARIRAQARTAMEEIFASVEAQWQPPN